MASKADIATILETFLWSNNDDSDDTGGEPWDILPTRLAVTHSGVDRVYASMQRCDRDRVDHLAQAWLVSDVNEWQTYWRTTIDDDTREILKQRAFGDAVETVDKPRRNAR